MSEYLFQRESFAKFIADAGPSLERHWDEIAWTKDLSGVDVSYETYEAVERTGMLRIYTARLDDNLIGYAVYIVKFHPHYKTVKWAVSDVYWIAPEHRGRTLGARMFKWVEKMLKEEGVKVMHTTGKTAHPQAKRLLMKLGHSEIEWGVGKILE